MEGTVRFGINNVYAVRHDGIEYDCTLKGKQLDIGSREYTPLAPGDRVEFRIVSADAATGVIDSRLPRSNSFARWNQKRNAEQHFAANIDTVLCVVSVSHPVFKPRFVDRVLAAAEWAGVEAAVILNKIDLGIRDEIREYFAWIRAIGYDVFSISAKSGSNLDEVEDYVGDKRTLCIGQSGVGKSSIINHLVPDADLRVQSVSRKYQAGVHTTRYATMIDLPGGGEIIDAPGIREIELVPESRGSLDSLFREFRDIRGGCDYSNCTHTHEPGCRIIDLVDEGLIPEFRYESYCSIYESLEMRFEEY